MQTWQFVNIFLLNCYKVDDQQKKSISLESLMFSTVYVNNNKLHYFWLVNEAQDRCCEHLKGNYYNLYDADYEKWTKRFKKYATLLDILLGVRCVQVYRK